MSEQGPEEQRSPAGAKPPTPRKPYGKPEFRRERAFETTALACGKIQPTQGQCRLNRKTS
jgi:hypothetical protein